MKNKKIELKTKLTISMNTKKDMGHPMTYGILKKGETVATKHFMGIHHQKL